MGALEGRVARLEAEMLGQSQGIRELKGDVKELKEDVKELKENVKELRGELKESVTRLDDKMSRHFLWLVGMLVTVLAAVIGGLIAR
ncbi:MAG: hypothetical protein ACRD1T_26225 [Acidimicrobiia bacterium]